MSDQWRRMSPHQTHPPTPKTKTLPTHPQQTATTRPRRELGGKSGLGQFRFLQIPAFLERSSGWGVETMEGSDSEHSEAPSDITTASPGGGELVGVKLKLTVVGDKGTIKVS